jgi:hypothetical protein
MTGAKHDHNDRLAAGQGVPHDGSVAALKARRVGYPPAAFRGRRRFFPPDGGASAFDLCAGRLPRGGAAVKGRDRRAGPPHFGLP